MRRLRTVVLIAVLLAVAALIGSLLGGLGGDPAPPEPVERETVVPEPPADRPRVEVLNGAGVPGLARRATDLLRDRGFDVVLVGNADEFGADTTRVVDRVGRPEVAEEVAGALGVGVVTSEPDSTLFLEVTVILGADWAEIVSPARGDADTMGGLGGGG